MANALDARYDFEAILNVRRDRKEERSRLFEAAAAVAARLRDGSSVMFWRWLCWQLLRLQDSTGAAPWYWVYEQVRRAASDDAEGFARKPGALLRPDARSTVLGRSEAS